MGLRVVTSGSLSWSPFIGNFENWLKEVESLMTVEPMRAVDPRQLELRSPREEFLRVVEARLRRLEDAGEEEQAQILLEARNLGVDWLPGRPGGSEE
jgi:hypothetical protein